MRNEFQVVEKENRSVVIFRGHLWSPWKRFEESSHHPCEIHFFVFLETQYTCCKRDARN